MKRLLIVRTIRHYALAALACMWFGVASSALAQVNTTTVVVSSANPSLPGDLVTFTAVVTGSIPTGPVTFFNGAKPIGLRNATAGSASVTLSALALGANVITAQFAGDPANFPSTSAPLIQVVNPAPAGTKPLLLRDINLGISNQILTNGLSDLVGGLRFFSINDGAHGSELWKTDGSAAGTAIVSDILLGPASSSAGFINASLGTFALTVATDPVGGLELWRTDGTPGGTALVKDICPGVCWGLAATDVIVAAGGNGYFFADDGVNGPELWKSDGTSGGTMMVKDIKPGPAGSVAIDLSFGFTSSLLTNVNGTIFFLADDGSDGKELWKSNGTAAGTVLVSDITPGAVGTNFMSFPAPAVAGGLLFFLTQDPSTRLIQLWRSDGTPGGTIALTTFDGSVGDFVSEMVEAKGSVVNPTGLLLFSATDSINGTALWKSDGTVVGTSILFADPTQIFSPGDLVNRNGTVFFSAADVTNGRELWKSDGTIGGTVLAMDINPGVNGSNPTGIGLANGTLFFFADGGAGDGSELWKSDGSAGGTSFVKDINAGLGNATPTINGFYAMPGGAVFFADDGINRTQLWKTDGTAAGTIMLPQVSFGTTGSITSTFRATVGERLFFLANDGSTGNEPWVSDGTPVGTVFTRDIRPGTSASAANFFTEVRGATLNPGGLLMFSANDGTTGVELWKSDGTAAGTVLVKDIRPGGSTSNASPASLTNVNGTLFFSASDGTSRGQLWKSDGTTANTVLVKDLRPGSGFAASSLSNLSRIGTTLYFQLVDATSANNLWKSDGTDPGTVLVKDISPGVLTKTLGNFTDVNGALFFTASEGANGVELWKSDGTGVGTVLVKDINPGPSGSNPVNLTAVNGKLFFVADDGAHGTELWTSDGTLGGTSLVKDITPGLAGTVLRGFKRAGGALVFTVGTTSPFSGPGSPTQLWRSDGTDMGTVLVKDFCAGKVACISGISTSFFFEHSGYVFFVAFDESGSQLWRTDGTLAGTVVIHTHPRGTAAFGTFQGTNSQGIFVSRSDNINGREPWFYPFNTTPAFAFAPVSAAPNTVVTSDTIIPAPLDIPVLISVVGGSYSIGCTAIFVTTPSIFAPGQSVCVRHTTSATSLAQVTTTLTIGGGAAGFTSTAGVVPIITSANATTFFATLPGTFTFTATGVPPPTLTVTGSLPNGVAFSAASGTLAGTPATGTVGSYPLTVTASIGAPPNATQNFTLTVAKAAQTILFGALANRAPGSPPFTISATGGASGNPVVITSSTTLVCNAAGLNGTTVLIFGTGLCTLTANQAGNADYLAAAPVSQSFNIKFAQAITFAALPNHVVGDPAFLISATGGASGNPVIFTTATLAVCGNGGLNGSSIVVFAPGTCTIDADQVGDANYLDAARVSRSFFVSAFGAPGAPTITTAAPGNLTATISFAAPGSSGTSTITGYTAICNPGSVVATRAVSPITVTGLLNGTSYSCVVFATNASGDGPPSAPASVTPSDAVVLLTVVSRKTHGGVPFDLSIAHAQPLIGAITVEPRTIGPGHTLIFHFDSAVTSVNAAATALDSVLASAGTATAQAIGGDVVVTLTNVADNKRLTISLAGLNGSGTAQASLGFLVGDVTSLHSVNAADISAVKANVGKPVTTNAIAKFDLNADGSITQADVSAVKARSGTALAP